MTLDLGIILQVATLVTVIGGLIFPTWQSGLNGWQSG
jgi:hypothetical protein